MLTIQQIRTALKTHQLRLKLGDELPFMTVLADRAGVHRDTLYSVMQGNRICERTQYALSRVLEELEGETIGKSKTRVMNISLGKNFVNLGFGIGKGIFR
jgi:DNA-binding transcriptional regulator YhcF (GntR family)